MKTVICPGSFDPVTNGHLDIIRRSSKLFDKVIVVVMKNPSKTNFCFSPEERAELISRCIKDFDNVEVDIYEGLLAEYAKMKNAVAVVKGLRAVSDFEYEFQQAQMNKKLIQYIGIKMLDMIMQLKLRVTQWNPNFIVEILH